MFTAVFCFVVLLGIVPSLEGRSVKHKDSHSHKRVINGLDAENANWGFIAQLNFHQPDAPFKICGGALIHPRFVLTAGHCTQGLKDDIISVAQPQDITVGLGRTDRSSQAGGSNYSISRIIPYPRYKEININLKNSNYDMAKKIDYDIALLELSRPATISDKVQVISLRELDCPQTQDTNPIGVEEEPQPTSGSQDKIKKPVAVTPDEIEEDEEQEEGPQRQLTIETTPATSRPKPTKPANSVNGTAPDPQLTSPQQDDGEEEDVAVATPTKTEDEEDQATTSEDGLASSGDTAEPVQIVEDSRFSDCKMAGWGSVARFASVEDFMKGDYTPSPTLKEMDVKVVTLATCSAMLEASEFGEARDASNKVLCGTYKESKTQGCLGDSGSPMVCSKNGKKYLDGVTVAGNPLCDPDAGPMVFTKVASYLSWIDSVIYTPSETTAGDETLQSPQDKAPQLGETDPQSESLPGDEPDENDEQPPVAEPQQPQPQGTSPPSQEPATSKKKPVKLKG